MTSWRSGQQQVQAEVEGRAGVGQRADGDEVDAGLRDRARPCPAAGRRWPPAGRRGTGRARATAARRSARPMLSSRMSPAPAASASRTWSRCRTRPRAAGPARRRARPRIAAADPARRRHVVVLDQRGVAEAHAVVDPAAAAHGVLLQLAQPGRGLAGVAHRACRCRPPRRPTPCVAVAIPDRWVRKLSRVRSAPSSSRSGALDPQHLGAAADPVAVARAAAGALPAGSRRRRGRPGPPAARPARPARGPPRRPRRRRRRAAAVAAVVRSGP